MPTDGPIRKKPVFPSAAKEKPPVADSPETLFGELPRTRGGVAALWSHQADQLREYVDEHVDTPDVALELPTGSGKTLVGLLVGEWRRRALGQRVVYACPTVQLARQVARSGREQGIPVQELTGKSILWNAADTTRYTSGDAIAVTTYSHIFNTNSRFKDAKTIIFDDAHAAEGYVAEAWSLDIDRNHSAYSALFDALEGEIDEHLVRRMTSGVDAASTSEIRMLPMSLVTSKIGAIDTVLDAHFPYKSKGYYELEMIRAHLETCLFYVSRGSWYIRPMIPPTFDHPAFTDPTQRVYLSATLGDSGELERAFGREKIVRVPVPSAWERTGSGRRFFVFPDLADPEPASSSVGPATPASEKSMLKELVKLDPKRLILTPSDKLAVEITEALDVSGAEEFRASNVNGVEDFLEAERGTLLAASRYDGMDLADAKCRVVVMSGVPSASHLQDRFLESKLRAGTVLSERIRTRIIQGAGRCTRGPQDWAVIVVTGEELLRYFSDAEHTTPMRIELQAEIDYGLRASRSAAANVVALTASALAQDDDWRESAEPALVEGRRHFVRTPSPVASELAASAEREVKAWKAAWQADWEGAAKFAVAVLENLTADSARPYRALWAYLASAWFTKSVAAGNTTGRSRAADLLKTAQKAAEGTVWLREVEGATVWQPIDEPSDEDAVARVLERLDGSLKSATKCSMRLQEMLAALTQPEATSYEQGLTSLGIFLGAESWKPAGQGKADSVWLWSDLWITVEAKSEQTSAMLSMDYVRKANTHLDSLVADQGVDAAPERSFSVIVPQKRVVDPLAVPIARPHLYLANTEVIVALAHDAQRAWNDIRAAVGGLDPVDSNDKTAQLLWEHNILPSQVRDRLTHEPIRA